MSFQKQFSEWIPIGKCWITTESAAESFELDSLFKNSWSLLAFYILRISMRLECQSLDTNGHRFKFADLFTQ